MTIARNILPFRRAGAKTVTAHPWLGGTGGSDSPLAPDLPTWDTTTRLSLKRHATIDVTRLRAEAMMPADARLILFVSWHSTLTSLRGRTPPSELPAAGRWEAELGLDLDPALLGGDLHLFTRVALADFLPKQPLRAHLPGTVLWEDLFTTALEGDAARFPTEQVAFSSHGPWQREAAWHLDFDASDFELPVSGSLMLYLNTEHTATKRLIADPDSEESKAIGAALQYDVARRLVLTALTSDAFHQQNLPWQEHSVGKVMERLLKRLRHDNLAAMRALVTDDPNHLETILQARLGFMGAER